MSETFEQALEGSALQDIFPEAKLTMRDRLPMNFILTNALITIQKSILNIKYSSEEIKEAIQGFVAMIPDGLKDKEFNNEMDGARIYYQIENRPYFCGVPANDEYCQRMGIQTVATVETFDYFKVLHACFNLLHRRHMLLKIQPKEIFTGHKARGGEDEYNPEEEGEL